MNTRTSDISGIACAILILSVCVRPMHAANKSEIPPVTTIRVPNSGIQPRIVERDAIVHLLYFTGDPQKGDLMYTTSPDYGRSFSKPIRVNSEPGTAVAIGNIRGGQMG